MITNIYRKTKKFIKTKVKIRLLNSEKLENYKKIHRVFVKHINNKNGNCSSQLKPFISFS